MRRLCALSPRRGCPLVGMVALLLVGAGPAGPRSGDQCVITVPFAPVPPHIDGKLDDACWQSAAQADGWSIYTGGKLATEQTVAKVVYDVSALYVGFVAYESQMNDLVMTPPDPLDPHDTPKFFQADEVEMFLNPTPDRSAYFQFCGNAKGGRYDGSSIKGGSWNGWWRMAGTTQPKAYVVEMAIPFTSLIHGEGTSARPRPGDRWRVNFCRMQYRKGEWSAWSFTSGRFHRPSRFGHLIFGPYPANLPDVRLDWPDKWGFGHRLVWVRVGVNDDGGEALDCRLTVHHDGQETRRIVGHLEPGVPGSACPFSVVLTHGGQYDVEVRAVGRRSGIVCCAGRARVRLPDVHGIFTGATLVSRQLEAQVEPDDDPRVRGFHARCADLNREADSALRLLRRARNATDWDLLTQQADVLWRRALALEHEAARLRAAIHCRERHGLKHPLFGVGVEGSLQKVFGDEPFRGRIDTRFTVWSAANEAESFQIVVLPLRDRLRRVRLRPTDLTGPRGTRIRAACVRWHPVGTVEIVSPPFQVRRTGPHPDPLLPAEPVDVPEDRIQPFWVTVHVPADTQPGTYTGKVWVQADGAPMVPVELTVRVWEFALPRRAHLRLNFRFSGRHVAQWYRRKTLSVKEFARWAGFLAQYRLGAYWVPGIHACPIPITLERSGRFRFDYRKLDAYLQVSMRHGLNALNVNFSADPVGVTGVLSSGDVRIRNRRTGRIERVRDWPTARRETLFRQLLGDYLRHLKAKGWADVAFYQGMDEPGRTDSGRLRRLYALVRQAAPDLPRLAAGAYPGRGLDGYIDVWCPLTPNLDVMACQRRRQHGEHIWWYVCSSPRPPHANFLVPQPAIEHRMLFWQTWQHEVTGLLYGSVNRWTDGPSRPGTSTRPRTKRWPQAPFPLPHFGDGVLVYPGPRGPLPSLRLEVIRDGIEDYEYFYLLRGLVEKGSRQGWHDSRAVDLAQARKALTIGPEIAKTLTDYSRSPQALQRARVHLAEQIVALRRALGRK